MNPLNWMKYRLWKPVEFAAGDAAKAAAVNTAKAAGRAAWGGARSAGRRAPGAAVWAGKRVVWPVTKQFANAGVNTVLQAGHVLKNWGMGGTWKLFQEVDNPSIVNALKAGASPNVLKKLGYVAGDPDSMKILTFNTTLRKRLLHGAIGVAAIGSLRATGGEDPRIPVYDNTTGMREAGDRSRGNMGADGDLALSMYYNNR